MKRSILSLLWLGVRERASLRANGPLGLIYSCPWSIYVFIKRQDGSVQVINALHGYWRKLGRCSKCWILNETILFTQYSDTCSKMLIFFRFTLVPQLKHWLFNIQNFFMHKSRQIPLWYHDISMFMLMNVIIWYRQVCQYRLPSPSVCYFTPLCWRLGWWYDQGNRARKLNILLYRRVKTWTVSLSACSAQMNRILQLSAHDSIAIFSFRNAAMSTISTVN